MSNLLFGFLGASAFIAIGVIAITKPDQLLRVARESNEGRFWTKNPVYEFTMRSDVYIPMMRIIGWTSLIVGIALVAGLVFLSDQP